MPQPEGGGLPLEAPSPAAVRSSDTAGITGPASGAAATAAPNVATLSLFGWLRPQASSSTCPLQLDFAAYYKYFSRFLRRDICVCFSRPDISIFPAITRKICPPYPASPPRLRHLRSPRSGPNPVNNSRPLYPNIPVAAKAAFKFAAAGSPPPTSPLRSSAMPLCFLGEAIYAAATLRFIDI